MLFFVLTKVLSVVLFEHVKVFLLGIVYLGQGGFNLIGRCQGYGFYQGIFLDAAVLVTSIQSGELLSTEDNPDAR